MRNQRTIMKCIIRPIKVNKKTLKYIIVFLAIANCLFAQTHKRQVGKINYEIKDHLGNVSLVVNDVKEYDTVTAKTAAHVQSAMNYYAFGMEMPGRVYSSPGYRYGYNGKEKDNELKGTANSLDYGARTYDPRLARFLSNDPLQSKFAWQSPYVYAANNSIYYIDKNGEEPVFRLDGSYLGQGQNSDQRGVTVMNDDGVVVGITRLTLSEMVLRVTWGLHEGGGTGAEFYANAMENMSKKPNGTRKTESSIYSGSSNRPTG